MPVNRAAPTPSFHSYITTYVLVDVAGNIPSPVLTAGLYNLTPLHIPTFQRGITWGIDDLTAFLFSKSLVLGHVVLAKTQSQPLYTELVDGLQRFTVGTALLHGLYPLVLSSNAVQLGSKPLFSAIANYTNNFYAVVDNNHQQLYNHPRRAIQDQYRNFYDNELIPYLTKIFLPNGVSNLQRFAFAAVNTFCSRQIAIDDFTGFTVMGDLVNTFLGINTIRVELNTVDLLRTHIVDIATPVWNSVDIEAVENSLTDVFMRSGKSVFPIATALQQSMPNHAANIFPTWNVGSSRQEVESFLDFIDCCANSATTSSYLYEIAEVGSLPFCLVILCYYRNYLSSGALPSFATVGFNSNSTVEDLDLHNFLRAAYRSLLSGNVGQLGAIAEEIITTSTPFSMTLLSEKVSAMSGAGSLSTSAPVGWIRAQLEAINKDKAKRVFNACLLPQITQATTNFEPLKFGRKTGMWQVDHLLPESTINSNLGGGIEANRLRNFAPLQSQHNRIASNINCSSKLSATGLYAVQQIQLHAAGKTEHPYLTYLRSSLPNNVVDLDSQMFLVANAIPAIGDARLQFLATELATRL